MSQVTTRAWPFDRDVEAFVAAGVDGIGVSVAKVGTLAANGRVVMGDGDIPLARVARALAAARYDGWDDIELLGHAIEDERDAPVVPRALQRFRTLFA